ncbi:MAG: hypothetical protein SGI89_09905 [bacterium]|nr:hypothetical protein [bacterium]
MGQDTFKISYINGATGRRYLARSIDFGITWSDTQLITGVPKIYESIVKGVDSTNIYMGFNKWIGSVSYMYKAVSTDGGYSFLKDSVVMELGEDKSFLWNEDSREYWGYVRPRNITNDCFFIMEDS